MRRSTASFPQLLYPIGKCFKTMGDQTRISYRGTAAELREVLRELLDHLAPDADVLKSGIRLEAGQTTPTM